MNQKTPVYLLAFLLCLVIFVGSVSALDDLVFRDAKQDLINQYSGSTPGKPVSGMGMGSPFFYVGQLPWVISAGDSLNIRVHGDMFKGQAWSIQILNGQFMTPGEEFVFNVSDVIVPADSDHVNLRIAARPVSFLRLEYLQEGELRSLESSTADPTGMISLEALDQAEGKTVDEFIVVKGTPVGTSITMNELIEGVLLENVSNPTVPFHIDELQRGTFTVVVSIDGREKLRQTIFAL